jgi:nucleoside-diphosphate-sugar epimerase
VAPLTAGKPKAVLILGCGYLGKMVAQKLAFGGRFVVGTARRDPELQVIRTRGAEAVFFDGADLSGLERYRGRIEAVIQAIPPSAESPEGPLIAQLHAWGATRAVYVSSTAVYGDRHGEVVTEASPIAPDSPRAQLRQAAEEAWLGGPIPASVVRPAGIYGPTRSMLHRLAARTHRLIEGTESTPTNRIHVSDLVAIVVGALGARPGQVFLGADGVPAPTAEVAAWCVAEFGLPGPTTIPLAEARVRMDRDTLAMFTHGKRIDPAQTLATLGVRLQFPDYKAGLRSIWLREQVALRQAMG